jgi:antitoxin component YwqK of YwqJK toxin-antitoxin module
MNEDNYVDGKEEGICTSWFENGQKKSEIKYTSGLYDGEATLWDLNGQISMKGIYKNGVLKSLPINVRDSIHGNKQIPVF